jgi:glycosyltransferase involved in cell wall biosynthesis
MNRKKIWIICHYASPLKYGHGARHFLLAEEFIKRGYQVTIFASVSNFQLDRLPELKGTFTHELVNGVEVVWVKGIRYSNPSGFLRIISWFVFSILLCFYRTAKESLPGIIIVSSLSLVPVINGIILKRRSPSSQFIFEVRDIWPQTLIDIGGYSKYNPLVLLLGLIEKAGYRSADNIVATMPRADLHISRRINKKFSFKCIPQGIHFNHEAATEVSSENFLEKLIPGNGFIVGYAGAIGISNCLDTLVRAAALIRDKNIADIYFVFLGDGNARETLTEMAKGLQNVLFLPKVPKNKVQNFLAECSVLHDSVKAVPIYNYGLSRNKWMDYMLSGKPLVVSYSGYVSLINEAECGTVVPAGDHVALAESIMNYYGMSKPELQRIGNNGRDFVLSHRTFKALAGDYMELFRF